MDSRSQLTLVGISHRTAAVGVRERFVVSQADLASCLGSLLHLEDVSEAFVLSTCNRTEALVVGPRGIDLAPQVRARLFRNLAEAEVYVYRDVQAAIHLFRVASGLDSIVVGESEVLAQIKRSMEVAQETKCLGTILRSLLQQALHVGKRIRTETDVGRGTLSVARVGIEIAARVFGNLSTVRALVVGAGETGVLVARHLKSLGVGELACANRTLERAQAVAVEFNASAHGLEAVPALIAHSHLVVACVEGQTAQILPEHFDRREIRRRDRPLLVIDLSIPRAVGSEVSALDRNLLLYDLDDLAVVVRENKKGRDDALDGATEILVAELHKFLALRTYAAFSPAIAGLRERFEQVREGVLDVVAGARSEPKDVQLAHELTRRLLDVALDQMKEGARHVRSEESLDQEYRRFLEGQR